jgi:GNAT superfamily N-acetyltransferase
MNTQPTIIIRKAHIEDAALLAGLGQQAFISSFGEQNSAENLANYLSNAFSEAIQQREISTPGCTYFIAECDGEPSGFARIQGGSTDYNVTADRPIELVRFYVMQPWIGKGLAAPLMQACLETARTGGHDVIWLGVWSENPRAIRFYQKWGFEKVGTHIFMLGADAQLDFVMAQNL